MKLRRTASLFRKAIIVVLTLAAVGTGAAELGVFAGHCRVRSACPRRVHLGRSDSGAERFVYSASDSWFSTVGYIRLFIYQLDGGAWDDESEAWFHMLCAGPLYLPGGSIVDIIRNDDIFPSHVYQRAIVVPRGLFPLVFAAYPTIAFIRGPLRRHRRRKRGLCLRCGYDLRGTTGGVCSECGQEVGER